MVIIIERSSGRMEGGKEQRGASEHKCDQTDVHFVTHTSHLLNSNPTFIHLWHRRLE